MKNSSWTYCSNWEKGDDYGDEILIYTFKNNETQNLIKSIIIENYVTWKSKSFLESISIHFSDSVQIKDIYKNIKNLCKNKKHIYLFEDDNKISLERDAEFISEELIYYLEKIEEISPLKLLKKILSTISYPYNYPKILQKNGKEADITKINFIVLSKLDKNYCDNFVNSLNFEDKLSILKSNKYTPFEFNYSLLSDLIKTNLNNNQINEIVKATDLLIKCNEKFEKIYTEC